MSGDDFAYTLALLTHGPSETFQRTLFSFLDKVRPAPARILYHHDGPAEGPWTGGGTDALGAEQFFDSEQRGFCGATKRLWKWAGRPASFADEEIPPYTFWLEHDFVFLRPVDLSELAEVLDSDSTLAQMALMRNAVSREEVVAGGLYQLREGDYEARVWEPLASGYDPEKLRGWLAHRAYFTTNPSLMRTDFMTWNQWPDDDLSECEGRFGIDLVRRGFSFGVWGSGEPWVEHIGRRDGFGY